MEILACPHCQRLFFTPPGALGKKIRCRGCRQIFHVPKDTSSVPLAPAVEAVAEPAESLPIAVPCIWKGRDSRRCPECGREFLMKESFVGKSIRCRGCKETFRVTATASAPVRAAEVAAEPIQTTAPPEAPIAPRSFQQPPPPSKPPPPTVFEDMGDILDELAPGERVPSVVRPKKAARRPKPAVEALAMVIAVVLGGVCALPIV